jgi:hypothetical protein
MVEELRDYAMDPPAKPEQSPPCRGGAGHAAFLTRRSSSRSRSRRSRCAPAAAAASRRTVSIVCPVPPLASSGPIYIGAVIVPATLFLWWLLRAEARESAAETAEEAAREGEDPAVHAGEESGLSAP